jgi:hypothetical protein
MKNIVRAFVVVLVLTGVSASTHKASASTKPAVSAQASALPIPVCPPDGTTDCGLGCLTVTCVI